MITLTREEAQQVLDAMIPYQQKVIATTKEYGVTVSVNNEIETAIEILRARLSAPEPEPVACKQCGAKGIHACVGYRWEEGRTPPSVTFTAPPQPEPVPVACPKEPENIEELYTAPPQREWQSLTDEECDEIWDECLGVFDCLKMTEAKLKEKNK